jgi:preprotein translocase subunit SecG
MQTAIILIVLFILITLGVNMMLNDELKAMEEDDE